MDPDESLAQLRAAIDAATGLIDEQTPQELELAIWAVADRFQELDIWLRVGGFKPKEWR